MSRLSVLFALFVCTVALPYDYKRTNGICDFKICKCAKDIHPAWTTINCTIPNETKMDILNFDLPASTVELTIQGGDGVMFGTSAFNNVTDLRRIRVSDTKIIVFRSFAGVDLSVLNVYLDIERCDILRFEKNSFHKMRGPLSVNIFDCGAVSVEGDTFSWLLNIEISNVRELILGSGSFSLDPTAANVGDHGPGMSVELRNTTISEFPKSTFGSSAAKVFFDKVDIHAIRTGAFSANTYNVVLAINCSIHLIEEESFSEKSLINYLNLDGCKIQELATRAFRSAIADINIKRTRFDRVETGAINTTVATVKIMNSEFHDFMEKGFELSSWNSLQMENNSFDELPPNAIVAPAASVHKLLFNHNEIETMYPESLSFIGKAATREIVYLNNYFGQTCHCNISHWLTLALGVENAEDFEAHSYCTVNEVLARCFNVHDQNMLVKKFLKQVCTESSSIKCEQIKSKDGIAIKNPRFPHKYKQEELSARNKKVIGILLISCFGCAIIALIFSIFKWWRRSTGGCVSIKVVFFSFNAACASMCSRICTCKCGSNTGIDNARSISQLSVNEYSERHRLNESRAQDIVQESSFHDQVIPTEEKFTQTLPEELTKELLDNLKERLDNPENYVEAREMIEHLYELTKITDEAPKITNLANSSNAEENIYELPYQNTTLRVGSRNKQMVSIGTRVPSIDKLMPLSPYYRQTALSHEYFEPRDLAVHLYAEIANNDREKRTMLGAMPDVIGEQIAPRGPYLRAVLSPDSSSSSSPSKSASSSTMSPRSVCTIKSNSLNSSTNMINRPLPEKPQGEFSRATDPGEGTSLRLG